MASVTEAVRERESETGCPECGGDIRRSGIESACEDCGLVTDTHEIEVPAGVPDEALVNSAGVDESKRHRGPASQPDGPTLGSYIGFDNRGGGDSLRWRAMRRQHKRGYADSSERRLRWGEKDIDRMATAAGFGEDIKRTANQLLRQAQDGGWFVGRGIDEFATASLIAAARIHGQLLPFEDAVRLSRVGEDRVKVAFKILTNEMGAPIPLPNPADLVAPVCDAFNAPQAAKRRAQNYANGAHERGVCIGYQPKSIAAAAIYEANRHIFSQQAIADEIGSNAKSLRDCWRQMREADIY